MLCARRSRASGRAAQSRRTRPGALAARRRIAASPLAARSRWTCAAAAGGAHLLTCARRRPGGRRRHPGRSLCGDFLQLSLPEPDFETALAFWERAGFVGMPPEEAPYAHQPLTSDQLDLAFHAVRTCDAPLLVFEVPDVMMRHQELRKLAIAPLSRPPRALQGSAGIVLEAPEGTLLLLQQTLME